MLVLLHRQILLQIEALPHRHTSYKQPHALPSKMDAHVCQNKLFATGDGGAHAT